GALQQGMDPVEAFLDCLQSLGDARHFRPAWQIQAGEITAHNLAQRALHAGRQAYNLIDRPAELIGSHGPIGERVEVLLPLSDQVLPSGSWVFRRWLGHSRPPLALSQLTRLFVPPVVFGSTRQRTSRFDTRHEAYRQTCEGLTSRVNAGAAAESRLSSTPSLL